MIDLRRSGLLIASAAAFAFAPAIGSSPANAAAVSIVSPLKSLSDLDAGVEKVQNRRRYGGHRSGSRRGMSRRSFRSGGYNGGRRYSGRSYRGWNGYRNRGYRYGGYRGRRHNILPYIGLGIAGALLHNGLGGSSYGYSGYDGYSSYRGGYGSSAMNRCAQRFRSFEWDTGYYTTYGGDKRLCPYLR